MPTRKQLSQQHPSCCRERNAKLRALYEGDESFHALLTEFLPRRPQEAPEQYQLRRKEAVYKNYVGPICDYFAALLFSSSTTIAATRDEEPVEAEPYYAQFQEDCDRAGRDLLDTFKAGLLDAMQVKRAWFWLKHPTVEPSEEPQTRADFELLGIGDSWIELVPDESVLDWETDDAGNLAWVVIYQRSAKRSGIGGDRSTITDRWFHVQSDRTDLYETTFHVDRPPTDDDVIPLKASTPHRYGTVPVVCMDLPHAIWVANRIASPQVAHFRLSNMQMWGMSRTCYAMPVFKCDSEESTKPTMGAGLGIMLGLKESLEWAAPPVDCYGALGEEIKSYKDEIYRIPQTMALGVENNAAAVGRTAESKAADARATAVVMLAFARHVKEAIERVYDLVSRARGDEYVWSVDGLDAFEADDVTWLADVLTVVDKTGGIPSKTFNAEVKTRLAMAILSDLDEAKKREIGEEIQAGVVEAEAQKKAEAEAALQPPAIAGAPGGKKPPPFAKKQSAAASAQ